ncbi:MAG: hypothetical protein H6Q17_917 [Bacteroidetes bacterium]|nr:hypothetical protein [Bacteroidota bacterium]
MKDYMPNSDAGFNVWQLNLLILIAANLAGWGIEEANFAALQVKQKRWSDAYTIASNKQNRTSADVQEKTAAREDYEKALRLFVAEWLSSNSKVSDSDRERMGLTIRTESRTPAPAPTTRPVGTIDYSVRLQHTVLYQDEASGRSKAKPAGVHGCEIWMKKGGDAPKSASELSFQATCTASPYTVSFDGGDAGVTVYYWIRWINTRGERGPWSAPFSGMIVG